ncbi:MAG: hypothetical protein GEU71_18355, partial [Actinobacteria bacterium]|nr:hypothetical protein [Actinomycetota bacterium]
MGSPMVDDQRNRPIEEFEITPRKHRPAALVAVLCLLGGLIALMSPTAQAGLDDTPDDRVLVVTTNLQEAYGISDVNNLRDMRNYVDRLLKLVPNNPDVLNLQEITAKGARFVRDRLSKATGDKYIVAIAPKDEPYVLEGQVVTKNETAIVINNTTMKKEDAGGFLVTTYKAADKAPGVYREKKTQAYVSVSERSTRILYALTSTHFSLGTVMKNKKTAEKYKGKWAEQIDVNLNRKYPTALKVITGDFNTGRCLGATTDKLCEFTPTWKAFHDGGYRSAVHLLTDDGAFDHIYTPAGIHRANHDGKYNPRTADPKQYYSDHELRWALLSSDVTPPSAPSNVQLSESQTNEVRITWDASIDDSSGVAEYQIWRKGETSDEFNLRHTTTETHWT